MDVDGCGNRRRPLKKVPLYAAESGRERYVPGSVDSAVIDTLDPK